MPPLGNEKTSVQNPLIKYATEIEWTYINPDDKKSERDVRFMDMRTTNYDYSKKRLDTDC